jgi:hypothetical protein
MFVLAIAYCIVFGPTSTSCRDQKIGAYPTLEQCRSAGAKFVGTISDSGETATSSSCTRDFR